MDAREWDERYAAAGMVWSTAPNQFVEAELAGLPPGRALDLAAGEGRNTLWLAETGWQVTAVDFSQAGLDKGRAAQRAHPDGDCMHIDWVCADALTWRAESSDFGLAVLAYLQLPPEQRRTAVRNAFTALQVTGTFLLVAHDSSNIAEGTGGPQDPDVLCTAEDVLADLDGERFDVLRAERVPRVVPADDAHGGHGGRASRVAYDALVRLVRTA
ncbi:MAG: class I SAM-dependent methyltransferase [Nocardioidaceae bacterium]